MRASDIGEAKTNADVINGFNQRTSKDYQNYLQNQATTQNDAQLRNIQAAQEAANKNTGASNDAQKFNLTNYNSLEQQKYNTARQQQQDRLGITADKNAVLGNEYNDQLKKAQGLGSAYTAKSNLALQTGRDRSQQIAAIGDIGRDIYSQSKESKDEEEE